MENTIDYKLSSMILYHRNEAAKEYIKNNKVDINAQDQMGFSYLHCAVTEKNDDMIDFLLDAGININIQDEYGKTPLVLAIIKYGGDDRIIRHLIARGADMSIRIKAGRSAFELGQEVKLAQDILELLREAVGGQEDEETKNILQSDELDKLDEAVDCIFDYFTAMETYKAKSAAASKKMDYSKDADEQCNLGVAYCQKQDYVNAKQCFEIAAKAGSSTALGNLGLLYLKGNSVDVDEKKAFGCFKTAAEQGNILAMMQLSDMYRLGVGVKKNAAKSSYWKVMADSPEKYNQNKDKIKAKLDAFVKESDKLDAVTAETMCMEIVDLIPDPQTMYEETAVAYYTLGTVFEKQYNYSMALEAYKHAVMVSFAKKNPVIPYRIGCCYYHMKNEPQAKAYFRKAYKLGKKAVFGIDDNRYLEFVQDYIR